ncbi:MAG: hypothetical protein KME64_25110 [Scytonematopsis contorta HA4267-MV1]|nr:hypothetical protein [Scytonematopsis contorta HA4267-MV1]
MLDNNFCIAKPYRYLYIPAAHFKVETRLIASLLNGELGMGSWEWGIANCLGILMTDKGATEKKISLE